MDALRAGRKMQDHIFDVIEQRHGYDLGDGKEGKELYDALLSAVRDSGVSEAAVAFEKRFSPLLNADRRRGKSDINLPAEISQDHITALQGGRRGGMAWASAACVLVLGALIIGFSAFKMTAAEPSSVTTQVIPAKATEAESQIIAEPLQATESELAVTGETSEPRSETAVDPDSATLPEQDPSTGN
jgi:hypothetical protein